MNCYCSLKDKAQFNKWIVEQLGPVILGVKPSEILSFPVNSKIDAKELVLQLFKLSKSIDYIVYTPPKGCMKIIFYNKKILDEALRDKRNQKFLRALGYSDEYTLDLYIDLLAEKLKRGEMPHEIGIFLGYPLKDVMGFMGHPSLKLTKVNRWRVYGNPKLSDVVCEKIVKAKNEIKWLLEYSEPQYILTVAS